MPAGRKVIITCAVTGAAHTPTMSPYLPITREQIAQEAIGAAEAGAAIVHFHARNPEDGRPTPDPDVYALAIDRVRREPNVIVNITTSGGPKATVEDRIAAALRFKPELGLPQHGIAFPLRTAEDPRQVRSLAAPLGAGAVLGRTVPGLSQYRGDHHTDNQGSRCRRHTLRM